MSLACDMIGSDEESAQVISPTKRLEKDSFEEEELDYEEEDVEDGKPDGSIRNENDGLSAENNNLDSTDTAVDDTPSGTTIRPTDKDEGELDEDDELEEGEVKEDEESDEEAAGKSIPEPTNGFTGERHRERPSLLPTPVIPLRLDLRHNKPHLANQYWPGPNQNYNPPQNPRHVPNRYADRYNSRPAQPVSYGLHVNPPESAWERGLKQARELISKASKRKEEIDFDIKRSNLSETQLEVPSPLDRVRDRSPVIKRRRHSSSEDEVERRHRLAYDAAPWNNQNSGNSYNYRSNISSNHSAESYRDPWRRSKSPKPLPSKHRRSDGGDSRYSDSYRRNSKRSQSVSSISSRGSDSSFDRSPGRKLPYPKPSLEARSRYQRPSADVSLAKSHMDRIPKRPSNASPHYQLNDRISETKSFDSWSESLSESDSSSFFTNSDSESEESDAELAQAKSTSRAPKRSTTKHSSSARPSKNQALRSANTSSAHPPCKHTLSNKVGGPQGHQASSRGGASGKESKKVPIKMTFFKTQASLKKDRLIDEQLNGEGSDQEDPGHAALEAQLESQLETNSNDSSKFNSEDKQQKAGKRRVHKDSSSSSASSSNKVHRREELLMKLKQVEAAIERKLNSKKNTPTECES